MELGYVNIVMAAAVSEMYHSGHYLKEAVKSSKTYELIRKLNDDASKDPLADLSKNKAKESLQQSIKFSIANLRPMYTSIVDSVRGNSVLLQGYSPHLARDTKDWQDAENIEQKDKREDREQKQEDNIEKIL